jgi:hypothetical protein
MTEYSECSGVPLNLSKQNRESNPKAYGGRESTLPRRKPNRTKQIFQKEGRTNVLE